MQSKSMNGHAGQGGWATVVAAMLLACTSVQAQTKARLLPPLKSHLVAAAAAPQTTPPGWPQRFELLSGEHESKGFAVTQPGPLRISLQTSGVPLVVSLQRPDGRSLERQGTGQIVIDASGQCPCSGGRTSSAEPGSTTRSYTSAVGRDGRPTSPFQSESTEL